MTPIIDELLPAIASVLASQPDMIERLKAILAIAEQQLENRRVDELEARVDRLEWAPGGPGTAEQPSPQWIDYAELLRLADSVEAYLHALQADSSTAVVWVVKGGVSHAAIVVEREPLALALEDARNLARRLGEL